MLKGKIIWLIGASEGIGRALAHELARAGAQIILSARNHDRLLSLQSELPGSNHQVAVLDVTQPAAVADAWHGIATKPDIVIYNTGTYDPMPADALDMAKITTMIDTNLLGALRVLEHVVPTFVAKKSGHIVLVGSIAGYRGLPAAMGYGLSKAGIIHLAENLVCDLSKHNIKVQVVNPGFVKTRLTDKNNFEMINIIAPELAARRLATEMTKDKFEIRFPWFLSTLFKLFKILPYNFYFRIFRK